MHGRCQQTKTEKHETATCVPSSSLLLLLSHESTRALVQGTTARDEAADKQDQDQATRDRRVRPPLLLPLLSLSCEHARWELRLPQASKTESELVRSAINNQKITGLCGPMGDHKRPLWTVGAEGRC